MKILSKLFVPLEIVLVLVVFSGIYANLIWVVSAALILLALLYFAGMSIRPEGFEHKFSLIIGKVFGFSYSISVIAVMFRLLQFTGADTFLTIALASMILAVFVAVVMMLSNNELTIYLKSKVIRGIIYAVLTAIMLFFPGISLPGN